MPRVLQRTIPYCTSATKVGVWLAIFIPSSATLSPFLFPLAPLTLDSHRFATLLPQPSCGLATKQPACDTPHGKTALMCICESTKSKQRERKRKGEEEKERKYDRVRKKRPVAFTPLIQSLFAENNEADSKRRKKKL